MHQPVAVQVGGAGEGAGPVERADVVPLPSSPGICRPQSLVDWAALVRLRGTVVVLMGVDTPPAIAAALIGHGRGPGTPVAIISDGSTSTERAVRTALADVARSIADEDIRPPSAWVVGQVVGLTTPSRLSR